MKPLNENWVTDKIKEIATAYNLVQTANTGKPQTLGDLAILDISNLSTYKAGKLTSKQAFVIHHTGGPGTAAAVVSVLNQRGLGVQWIIDREGKIYRGLPANSVGGQIMDAAKYAPIESGVRDLTNFNTEGVEVVANNDKDILPVQVEAAKKLAKALGYLPWQVVPHGVVNMGHKEADEGYTICRAICPDCYKDAKGPTDGVWLNAYLASKAGDYRPEQNVASSTYVNQGPIKEMSWSELQIADAAADQAVAPVDVVLTDRHFWDRLNDPRNGREITLEELLGFFERLQQTEAEFKRFLKRYREFVVTDKRTHINIPFMKLADQAIAKTIMRSQKGKPYLTSDPRLTLNSKN